MSNAVFPKLVGLGWGCNPVPTWSTVVQRSKNGATTRLMNDPYPLWTFELSYEFLRDSVPAMPGAANNPENFAELQQIIGFYNARGGGFDDFLVDPATLTGRAVPAIDVDLRLRTARQALRKVDHAVTIPVARNNSSAAARLRDELLRRLVERSIRMPHPHEQPGQVIVVRQ